MPRPTRSPRRSARRAVDALLLPTALLPLAGLLSFGTACVHDDASPSALEVDAPRRASDAWTREWLVPGGPFRGIHGLAVGPDDQVWVGSVMGQSIHRIDPASGRVETVVAAPDGEADDLEFAEDGTLYFTGFMHGTLNARLPDGRLRVLAQGLPGMNSLALDARGRLFATQVFAGDALWEFDRTGETAPRLVRRDLGGLNGFDFGPDGRLCGPLWFRGQVICLDVDGGALEVVADGFETPAAANFDPDGVLHAIDNATGDIFRIDRVKREKTRIATAPSNLDNLAFGPDGRLFVTNMSDNALYEIDRARGAVRTVVASPLTLPGGIARADGTLYVGDMFSLSAVDLASGRVDDIRRNAEESGAPTLVAADDERLATASFHHDSAMLWDRAKQAVIARWDAVGRPSAIAMGSDGHVVVATVDGRLVELDPADPALRREIAQGLVMPIGLARSPRGWIVGEADAGRLVELADDGSRRVLATGLLHPEGIARLADGRIAVAEVGADRVVLIDPTTGRQETIATDLPLGLPDLPSMPPGLFPTGLAVDADGSLLLSSDVEGGILRLRPPDRSR